MTIEAGVLSLRVTQEGAKEVEAQLASLDAKAKALGNKAVVLNFQLPAAQIDKQLADLEKQVALYRRGTQFAGTKAESLQELGRAEQDLQRIIALSNTSLEQRIRAEQQLANISSSREGAGGLAATIAQFAVIGALLAGGAIVAGLIDITKKAIDAGDALHDLSMRTGVSVETLSVLGPVAEKSGANMEVLSVGFRNLAKEIEKAKAGNDDAVATFARLGISVDDLKGKSLDQVFLMIANAQDRFADGTSKADTMIKLFGRSGEALIPTLHELADGGFERAKEQAERFGAVISTEFSAKADQFNDGLVDLRMAVDGFGLSIADKALPPLTRLEERLTSLTVKSRGFFAAIAEGLTNNALIFLFGPSALSPHNSLDKDPQLDAAIKQFNQQIGKFKPELPGQSAKEKKEKQDRDIEKALGISLGNIPLRDALPSTSPGITPTVGVDSKGRMKGEKAFGLANVVDKEFDELEAKMKERIERIQGIVGSIAQSVGSAFGDAFTAAFHGGDFFKEFGKSLVSSLGNVVMQLGEQLLAYGLIIAPLAALLAFTPFGGLGLGAGASIAAGIALTALGAAMGAIGGKGGSKGGGSAGSGASSAPHDNTFALQFDPDRRLRKSNGPSVIPSSRALSDAAMPDARPVVQIGTINALSPDSQQWQRAVAETYMNARDRGLIKKAG